MRNVVFAACQDHEVAWETGGRGEFSVRTLDILAGGIGLSHDDLERRILAAFGPGRRQSPRLDCAPGMRTRMLLAPFAGGGAVVGDTGGRAASGSDSDLARALSQGLRGLADLLGSR